MSRLEIIKTYKIYIGGQFPRTESGRYYPLNDSKGKLLGNICLSSKKDIRNAVVAARKAFGGWSERAPFNRGQILYRIAEMLDARKVQFIEELQLMGLHKQSAEEEVMMSIDRCVYYAGWADKYQALISSVNPVASSHFNFSSPEAMGVVGIVACQQTALIGLISQILPIIIGGNTVVVIANTNQPLCAITFAEVLATSDVPGGVVNILSGEVGELLPTLAGHMDVNALSLAPMSSDLSVAAQEAAVDNLKRVRIYAEPSYVKSAQGLSYISDFQEIKTTWHPIEQIAGGAGGY